MRIGILTSHPIQYQAPWFRALAGAVDLQVFFAHRQTPEEQGAAGFGVAFDWDVDLLAGYEHRFLKNVAKRPGVNRFSGCDTPEIAEVIHTGGFDGFIVSGWYLKSYLQAARACRRAKVPVLVRGDSQLLTPRSALRRVAKEIAHRILLRRFDGFLVVGQRAREYLAHYGVRQEHMFFAPHFVDNEWFAARAQTERASRAQVRSAWGADHGTLVVLFVGKFQPIKRPGDILQALARLRQSGVAGIVVFVGAGELEVALRAEAASLGVEARFEGFKNQSELPRYYTAADALVLPSESETWGLVVNEAMASGVPAIVSEAVGCAPDLIDAGRTGFAYRTGDTGELADRLAALAVLKESGHDFADALRAKTLAYSVEAAVRGTVQAVQALAPGRHG